MYIARATISNLRTEGLLSGDEHLENYKRGLFTDTFHFHTLNKSLAGSLYLLSYYKADRQRAIENMTNELRSHSLKADLGDWLRLDAKQFKEVFGWN